MPSSRSWNTPRALQEMSTDLKWLPSTSMPVLEVDVSFEEDVAIAAFRRAERRLPETAI